MMTDIKIGCVVLAAGRGARFAGGNKLLMPLNSKPVAAHILEALPRRLFAVCTAVAKDEDVRRLCEVHRFPCIVYAGGLLSDSLRTGLDVCGNGVDGCLFVNADRPFLTAYSIERMVEAFRRTPNCVIRLAYEGEPSNPILFPKTAFEALRALVGDKGGAAILKTGKYDVKYVEAQSARELIDIDDADTLIRVSAYR